MKNILLLIISGILITHNACRTIIPIDMDTKDKKIVLNALLTPNGIDARVSLSLTLNDDNEDISFLNNSIVTLLKNGEPESVLISDPNDNLGHYIIPGFVAESGANYTIRVENEPYNSIEATCKMPPVIQIDTITSFFETITNYDYTSNVLSFFITIQDPANEQNYYFISDTISISAPYPYYDGDKQVDSIVYNRTYNYLETTDPSFESNSYNGLLLFSDELFNGQKKSLKVSMNNYYFTNDTCDIEFYLYSVSKDYYLFLKTLSMQEQMTDFSRFLGATPVQVFNNVENGFGYFGAENFSMKKIVLLYSGIKK
jgi:hypothetical protein